MKRNKEVYNLGKLDKSKYKCITKDIVTDEVIITKERLGHIQERHPEDYEKYLDYLKDCVFDPDYIIEGNKPRTAVALKNINIDGKNAKAIVRLITSNDNTSFKNSIITFQTIRDKEWNRLINNKPVLYKKAVT